MNSFCFCGLAMGKRYRDFARDVAADLAKFHPRAKYVLITDRAKDFANLSNVIAIKHKQQSIMLPYHDRRFAIEEALKRFDAAIQIDTDIRIIKAIPIPEALGSFKGILCGGENLAVHLRKYQPQNLKHYEAVSKKLGVSFEEANYIGEFIFAVTKDEEKERKFIHYLGIIGRYLELHGVCGADGPAMGLAAAKAGYAVQFSDWAGAVEHDHVEHFKAKSVKTRSGKWSNSFDRLKFNLGYRWRLNKARLLALGDFDFYYK